MVEQYMKAKRVLRFFVSSVGKLMDEERKILWDVIWKNGHLPIAMEGFWGNNSQTSLDVVIDNLNKADIVVIVLGFNYGSVIGKNCKCSNCPIYEICTGKKSKRQKECSISYTHFEYLYAKQKKIKSYCIIQKDIDDVAGLQKRLESLNYQGDQKKKIEKEYLDTRNLQLQLVKVAKANWSVLYDANSTDKTIAESLKEIFSSVVKDISYSSDELYGLVDGKEMLEELRERNQMCEELRTELDEIHRFYRRQILYKSPITAVTGTCIPFYYKESSNVIVTYLVSNSVYKRERGRLMFPGGHAFVNDESPEDIAIAKSKIEAGLVVSPIDLYKNFDVFPLHRNNSGEDSHFSREFCVYRPPHYTNLFTQDESAKCYELQNHHYHYDAVYVCEIKEILSEDKCTQRRIRIELPNEMPTFVSTKKHLEDNINRVRDFDETYGEYIVKMLYEAYRDYVSYLNRVQRGGNNYDRTT